RRDRVLVDELGLAVPAQQHAEIVEPGDDALQLDPVDQEDRDGNLRLADMVEKGILQILFVGSHDYRRLALFLLSYGPALSPPLGAAPGTWIKYAEDFGTFHPQFDPGPNRPAGRA